MEFVVGDAHGLAFADRPFDAAISLRVLMHTPDWRQCLGGVVPRDPRRVSSSTTRRWFSGAALQAMRAGEWRPRLGSRTEAYRVLRDGTVAMELARHGFRVVERHRQFVLPIALHKAIGSRVVHAGRRGTDGAGRPAAPARLARDRGRGPRPGRRTMRPGSGEPVLVTGGTGFTGGHLARGLASRDYRVRALARDAEKGRDLTSAGIEIVAGRPHRSPTRSTAPSRGVATVYNIAAIYRQAGAPASAYRAVNADGVGALIRSAARAGVRRVVHCSTVGVHGDVEHPPANEDAPLRPGDVYQETKLEGERVAREAATETGIELVIARPSGIYGPGDRRLLKLFRGVARRRFVILGRGDIYYHLTYIDDLVEGFRLCGTVPKAAGRTYILAGGEVGTLKRAGAPRSRARSGVKPPPRPPAGLAVLGGGSAVRGGVRAAAGGAATLPPPRGLLHEEPRVRHLARAGRAGLRAEGHAARGGPPRARVVPAEGVDLRQS